MSSRMNETLLFARYAEYLTLGLRAAIVLEIVRYVKGVFLSANQLAERMRIDPIAGRSFFNLLWSLGILDFQDERYTLSSAAAAILSDAGERPLGSYLGLGSAHDGALQ